MYAVGRLGSYISRGVYTVSGPFHPFGGAVDIIVVEQEDGSFKSSPWYVRFGKFQGVLKSKEKVVSICIEGVEPSFHMLLDNKGEAYFLREVVEGEDDESGLYPLSSVDSLDREPQNKEPQKERWQIKSKSCNFDSHSGQVNPMDMSKEKPVSTGTPNQSRMMGLFGRKPVEEEASCEKQVNNKATPRSSLERAEMAADLMDLQWSTNKKTNQPNASSLSSVDKMVDKDLKTNDEQSQASPESSSEKPKRSSEEASARSSCEKVVTISTAGESALEEKCEAKALVLRESNEPCVDNKDHDGETNGITGPSSRLSSETCDGNANGIISNEGDSVLQGCVISQMDSQKNGLQPSLHSELSDSSMTRLDDSSKQTEGTQCLGEEERGEALHTTTEPPSEDMHTEQPAGDTKLETELAEHSDENHCQQTHLSRPCTPERNKEDPKNSFTVTESNSQIHRVDPVPGSVEDVESHALSIIPGSSNSGQQVEDEKKSVDESTKSSPQSNIAFGGDTKKLNADSLPTEVSSDAVSQSSEEEQFLFGDLDEDKLNAVHTVERKSPDHTDKEDHPSFSLEETEEKHKSVSRSHESCSSVDQFGRENQSVDSEKSIVVSNPIGIPRTPKAPGEGVRRLGESVPNMWFHVEDLNDSSNGCHSLSQSLDASPKSVKWRLQGKDDSNCLLSDGEQEGQLRKEPLDVEGAHTSGEPNSVSPSPRSRRHSFGRQKSESKDMIAIDRVEKPSEGDGSKPPIPGRRWRIWPFVFRATRSTNDNPAPPPGYVRIPDSEDAADSAAESGVESAAESAEESPAVESPAEKVRKRVAESAPVSPVTVDEGVNELRPKGVKKMFRALTPTSDQLASLKLSEGKNSITFTFSTGMLGDQQVDARIYLWKWNTRIVISDVDGTITKSDVLGQFMPLVGIDWCQTGVTQLFSAIKENGYQLLFLSARAIAQATTTRQFLLNIKQDGKALPDGPIVISPDGLFPSLFREVIRRAPHEFKIACLEDIKALFPQNSNPFYAGFGNRDTDEISYLKVGIPMGKIFIINPKGEVAVNRRVDRKSYTSLHDLVHGMFPATEQEQEDFNSWNFWKLPSPINHM